MSEDSGPISSCSGSSSSSCSCGRAGCSDRGRSRRCRRMSEGREVPERPDVTDRPQIGVDEWVAEAEERVERRRGLGALLGRGWKTTPPPAKLLLLLAVAGTLPFWLNEGDLFSYGLYTLLYATLALGLNIVVGFAGLLDLGYVAFYGVGAYSYALLSSNHYGIHWQAELTIPIAVAGTALVGLVLGFSSRRLLGDYLAIVTLFFGQAFVAFTNNANPHVAGKGLTGGPNGIPGVDPLDFFGYKLHSTKQYVYFLLIVLALVAAGLYFLEHSRTGRAWKALREDPLAAEVMGMPVNRLKLLAFIFGAGTAGLCGTIFAALNASVFPLTFYFVLLITIYTMVILGGQGSQAGVVLGAILISVLLELLREPSHARGVFYVMLGVGLLAAFKFSRRLPL